MQSRGRTDATATGAAVNVTASASAAAAYAATAAAAAAADAASVAAAATCHSGNIAWRPQERPTVGGGVHLHRIIAGGRLGGSDRCGHPRKGCVHFHGGPRWVARARRAVHHGRRAVHRRGIHPSRCICHSGNVRAGWLVPPCRVLRHATPHSGRPVARCAGYVHRGRAWPSSRGWAAATTRSGTLHRPRRGGHHLRLGSPSGGCPVRTAVGPTAGSVQFLSRCARHKHRRRHHRGGHGLGGRARAGGQLSSGLDCLTQ